MITIFFEGAIYNKDRGTWKAVIRVKGKQKHLAHVPDPVSAHIIYKIAMEELELDKLYIKRCKYCNRIITTKHKGRKYCSKIETGRRCYEYAMQEKWRQRYYEYRKKYKRKLRLGTAMGHSSRIWKEWEYQILIDMYNDGASRSEIAVELNRGVRAIEGKIKYLRDTGRL